MTQTTSLRLSKKITEFGFTTKSTALWWVKKDGKYEIYHSDFSSSHKHYDPIANCLITHDKSNTRFESIINSDSYPAFTFTELLDILPNSVVGTKYKIFTLAIFNTPKFYKIQYINIQFDRNIIYMQFENINPAEAAGEMLFWCLQNGYVAI